MFCDAAITCARKKTQLLTINRKQFFVVTLRSGVCLRALCVYVCERRTMMLACLLCACTER